MNTIRFFKVNVFLFGFLGFVTVCNGNVGLFVLSLVGLFWGLKR